MTRDWLEARIADVMAGIAVGDACKVRWSVGHRRAVIAAMRFFAG